MIYLFWVSAYTLFHIYYGYGLLLAAISHFRRPLTLATPEGLPAKVTVLLTVHNERERIAARLRNLLDQDYPSDHFDILVASDGSDDGTDEIVESCALSAGGDVIRLIKAPRGGKSAAQNLALGSIASEIVILTDAATRFEPDFLVEIVRPFADKRVGCVTGTLDFVGQAGAVARGQGYYWRYEMKLRRLESELGVLAVASGQAMAFRRALFQPIDVNVGEDCMIPLDVALAGRLVVHQPTAHGEDAAEDDARGELRSRARMTMRNWTGTWLRPALLDPLHEPGYAFALWSHKLLRWMSPVILLTFTISAVALARMPFYGAVTLGLICLYGLGFLGWRGHGRPKRSALAETAFSFLLGNLGFLIGLGKALRGQRIAAYR